jgi:hypothetical protein
MPELQEKYAPADMRAINPVVYFETQQQLTKSLNPASCKAKHRLT